MTNSDIFRMDVEQVRCCYLDLRYLLDSGIDVDGSELPMLSRRRRDMKKRAQIAYSHWLEVHTPHPTPRRPDASRGTLGKRKTMNDIDTYYRSAQGTKITRERALRELMEHSATEQDMCDFDAEFGVHETYSATAVLDFLGY